jgi:hypothetical protein
MFKGKHRLNLSWLTLMVALGVGFHKLKGMAKLAPAHITEYRFRRLLSAVYWSIQEIMLFMVRSVLYVLPKPEDGTLYVILDASKKEKRSKKNPYGQKGMESAKKGYFFGVRFITLMFQWNGYRLPIAYELLYPKGHPLYEKENCFFRKMIEQMEPPEWATRIIVLADAAYTSKDNLKFLKKLNHRFAKKGIFFGFVMAMAKTWKLDDETHLKSYVRHITHSCFKKTYFTPITGTRRRTYWTFAKQLRLRHVGEVTIVFSKKRRNSGPKSTKVIVTNLPNATAHLVVSIYQRRFMVEVLFKELKTYLGLGKPQVTIDEERIKKSFGISFLAYLVILKFQHQDILPGKHWSIGSLQERFRYKVFKEQVENDREKLINKLKKVA